MAVEEAKAVKAWEDIFANPEDCARMSVEARVNTRMSSLARIQVPYTARGVVVWARGSCGAGGPGPARACLRWRAFRYHTL